MKKRLIICLSVALCALACAQDKERNYNKEKETEKRLIAMKDSLPQYPKEKQVSYILHMNTKTPYELYLDDILIARKRESGYSESVELNPYLLKNGTHKLKLRFLPRESSGDSLVHPGDIVQGKDVKWLVHFIELKKEASSPLGYSSEIDYEKAALEVLPPPSPVPFWEQEWEVRVENLPYDLRGWRDGEDLREWDPEELEKAVLAYYNRLRDMLHEGRVTEFAELVQRMDFETGISVYDTPETYESDYHENVSLLKKECVGNMLPIDNYVMKIYGDGKLVALQIPEGRYKYWSVLMSDSEKYGKSGWGIKIYKPRGEDDFVPIRK